MLGITAVATGGCGAPGAAEGGPAPGLRAPPFEEGAPSHFQAMLLGASAALVTESQLLVVQSCELQAWRATRGADIMPRCLERVSVCLAQLQAEVERAAAAQDTAIAAAAVAAATMGTPPARSPARHGARGLQPSALVLPSPAAVAAAASPSRPPASPFAAPAAQQAVLGGCDAAAAGANSRQPAAAGVAAVEATGGEPQRTPSPVAEGSGLTPPVSGRSLCADTAPSGGRGGGAAGGREHGAVAGVAQDVTMWYVNQQAVHGGDAHASGALPGDGSDGAGDAAAQDACAGEWREAAGWGRQGAQAYLWQRSAAA